MSRKKIPIFDIKPGVNPEIDIEGFFHMGEAQAISHNRDTVWLDDIQAWDSAPTHNLSLSHTLQVHRFRTLGTLDLMSGELADLSYTHMTTGERRRERLLDVNPPLVIPYWSLDVRKGGAGILGRKYADLFTRRLPFWLSLEGHYRLYHREIFTWFSRLAYTIGLLFLLALPLLFFIRFSLLESARLMTTLPNITSNSELLDTTRDIRAGFERSKLLITPYRFLLDNRLIHFDEIRALGGFIDVGTSLARWLHTLAGDLNPSFVYVPKDTTVEETPLTPVWRWQSKDFFPLERFGIDKPTEWLSKNESTIRGMLEDLENANQTLRDVDFLHNTRLENYLVGSEIVTMVSRIGDFYLKNVGPLLTMLGDNLPERYIIFNQNQDELRANGWFPGSVITFTLYKGNILDLRKDDVYYYDWNLFPYKEVPPPGIALLSSNFGLRDVNYFPIFRDSVEKANEFIEKSGDSTITTGIAIHQGILWDILREVGPITLTGISIPITADNFSALMSTLVEAKHAKLISPKDILFDFIDELTHRIIEKKKYLSVALSIEKSMSDGEIRVASRDDEIEKWLGTVGFSEAWLSSSGNWIYPVFTSLSGNKSDRYMTREYSGTSRVLSGCTIENTVTLRSRHTFDARDATEIGSYLDMIGLTDPKDREKLLFIEGNGPNKHYMRLIVPSDSEVISKGSGVEFIPGVQYATIAFPLETPVGGTSEKTIRYTTTPLDCSEKIQWFRQPWIRELEIRE